MSDPTTSLTQRSALWHWLSWPVRAMHGLYRWVMAWAERPGGTVALGAISFAEASFFPIPPDPLLWAMCIGQRRKSLWFATLTTVASVLGGVFGWILGRWLFEGLVDPVIQALGVGGSWYGSAASVTAAAPTLELESVTLYPDGYLYKVKELFNEWGFMALFGAALTPIPFKVATIASGMFGLGLPTVVVGSLLGRGLRFYAFGVLFHFFGDWAKAFIEKYFTLISIGLVVLLVAGFAAIKYLL